MKFVLPDDGILRLKSIGGYHDYMSFINYLGPNEAVSYSIRRIHTIDPKITFFEITATKGAHGMNCGYWLIGKRNGQWVTYVSLNSLAAMEYAIGDWRIIRTDINKDGTGRFILTSQYDYLPPGARSQADRYKVTDLQIEFFWDEKAQWIGMRRL